MITIFHGNDTANSRLHFINEKNKYPEAIVLEGKNVSFEQIINLLEGNSLFSDNKYLFVENFFAIVKSNTNEFKKITEYLNSQEANIFLWEDKELTKAQEKIFKQSKIISFNFPSNLFQFLDSLRPGNSRSLTIFKELEKTMDTEQIFYMIIRQFRLLIAVSDRGLISEAKNLLPWLFYKLKRQSNLFGENTLKNAYKNLYKIDYATKFGLTPFNLSASIDIFLADL